MHRRFSLIPLILLAGCGGAVAQNAATLAAHEVISTEPGVGGEAFVIRKTYSGGATGDTLHEAWLCRKGLSDCQRLAIIDTHDGPPPSWRATLAGATLLISATDVVWNYTNGVYGNGQKFLRLTITENN